MRPHRHGGLGGVLATRPGAEFQWWRLSFCGTLGLALLSRVLAVRAPLPCYSVPPGGIFPAGARRGHHYTVYALLQAITRPLVFERVETLKLPVSSPWALCTGAGIAEGVFRVFAARKSGSGGIQPSERPGALSFQSALLFVELKTTARASGSKED